MTKQVNSPEYGTYDKNWQTKTLGKGEVTYIDGNHPDYLPTEETQEWCEQCKRPVDVVEVHEEEVVESPSAGIYTVTDLSCGHSIEVKHR